MRRTHTGPDQLTIPIELAKFSQISGLLPGENESDFETIRQMMIDDIQPETNLEWLWLLDFVELSWEILRYRRMKERIIGAYRESAIQSILLRLDGVGLPKEASGELQLHVQRTVSEWRDDAAAAVEIETRLLRHNFDAEAINAEVYFQARDTFALFDGLMHSAQTRRMTLLREINYSRELAKRVERLSEATLEARNARNRRGRI
jgi:hypothetical protein